jgi:predicted  nucleic acid-binding Zn-ribbon protein
MLIEKIAEKIGRNGITEAARAMASSDDKVRYNFAKSYPDEPVARKLWLAYEAQHREEFKQLLAAARDRVRTRINHQYVDLDARLAGAAPALEAWLAEEQRGAAKEPRPDPSAIIEERDVADETELRSEIASLSGNLSRAKSREDQLKEEMSRLSEALVEASEETKRLREEGISLRQELSSAKSETGRVSLELQSIALNKDKLLNQSEQAAADLKARTRELNIAKEAAAAESKTRKQELDAANALITRLSTELESKKSPTNADEKPSVDGANSASKNVKGAGQGPSDAGGSGFAQEKIKPLVKSRLWGMTWKIGAAASVVLTIAYFGLVNSGSYRDRENAPGVLGFLLFVVLFSIFAYRQSRPRKVTIS